MSVAEHTHAHEYTHRGQMSSVEHTHEHTHRGQMSAAEHTHAHMLINTYYYSHACLEMMQQ